MKEIFKKRMAKAGLPPGTAVYIGEQAPTETFISVVDYTDEKFEEKDDITLEEALAYKNSKSISWIRINGLAGAQKIEIICRSFGIHPLVVEDILNTDQRPKAEEYDDYIFITLKIPVFTDDTLEYKQVSMILGSRFVLTFLEKPAEVFKPLRDRIRSGGIERKMGADYLAYALLDSVIDRYFLVIDQAAKRIELLEESMITDPVSKTLRRLTRLRTEMILLRRAVRPMRDAVDYLYNSPSPIMRKETRVYLRDLHDHCMEIIDNMETAGDLSSGMTELYLSSVSFNLNEVMKVLTIMSTIFIPLTFIAGLFGMNFKYMPGLDNPTGYLAVLILMIVISAGMIFFFRKKKWI